MKKLIVFIFCLLQSLSLGAACANQPMMISDSLSSYVLASPNLAVSKSAKKKAVRAKKMDYKKWIRIGVILIISGIILAYIGFL